MASKKPLSERQQRMLGFITQFSDEHGYPPTIRDIGTKLGISSTSVVSYNLKILEKEGLIHRDETISRGLKVVQGEKPNGGLRRGMKVPILGTIAAGQPLQLPDAGQYSPEDFIELTRDICSETQGIYALRVKGDSMIDALVNDGDLVIIRHQETVENGQMAAVWLPEDGETTLKYFYLENDQVRLRPANPTMKDFFRPAAHCQVKGKVIAVIRQM